MKRTFVNLALFLLVATVYYKSPVHYAEDSAYSLLMDEAILRQASPNMIAYQVREEPVRALLTAIHGISN